MFSERYLSFVLLYFDFWTILVHGSFDDSSLQRLGGTRNRESLDIPPSKTKSDQRPFLHIAVNIWSNLDKDFKQLYLTSFKKKLKTHMLENYFNDRFL